MAKVPTAEDVRKARKQATTTVSEVARTPLLAVLGAGDAAAKAITDTYNRTRSETGDRVEQNQEKLRVALHELQQRLAELPAELRELRGHLDAAQARKLADSYADVAQNVYQSLAERGEKTYGRISESPRVRRAVSSTSSTVDTAQQRVEQAVENVNKLADEMLGRFATGSRSVGEKAAQRTEKASEQAAEQVQEAASEAAQGLREAGEQTASTTRSTTRKTANRASGQRSTTRNSTSGGRSTNSTKSTS